MTKTSVVAAVADRLPRLVKQHADALRPKWKSIEDVGRAFIPKLLAFAVAYREAYAQIKKQLGNGAVRQLNAEIGLTDSAASRLRDIAEARPRLTAHVRMLPPSVDALHSVAVLATDQPKRFERAIEEGTITPALTVRDARLLQPPRRSAAPEGPSSPRQWVVRVVFDSREAAASGIAQLLSDDAKTRIRIPDSALREHVQEKIGKDNWLKVAARVK
jgi:hypothetical protein